MLVNDAVILLLRRLRWVAAESPALLAQTDSARYQVLVLHPAGSGPVHRGRFAVGSIEAAVDAGLVEIGDQVSPVTYDHFGTVHTALARPVRITDAGRAAFQQVRPGQ